MGFGEGWVGRGFYFGVGFFDFGFVDEVLFDFYDCEMLIHIFL